MSGISNYLTGGTDMSQEVYEANRPYYSSIYSSLDRAKQIAANKVKQSYGEQIGNTYLQGQQASANINSSALGANYKQYLQNQLQQNINRAYDTYLSNQQQDIAEATSAYDTAMQNLTSGINEQGVEFGEYRDRYATGLFQYGSDLIKQNAFGMKDYEDYKAYKDSNPNSKLTEEEFLKEKKLAELNWFRIKGLYDESGEANWDAIKTALYANRDENGDIITDEYGNVLGYQNEFTTQGQDLLNYLMTYNKDGFKDYQQWLGENDKDLYEWSMKRSALGDATNAYSAMKTLGLNKGRNYTDLVETVSNLTPGELDGYLTEVSNSIDPSLPEVNKRLWDGEWQHDRERSTKATDKAYSEKLQELKNIYKDLGLEKEMESFFDSKNLQRLFKANKLQDHRSTTAEAYHRRMEKRLELLIKESKEFAKEIRNKK